MHSTTLQIICLSFLQSYIQNIYIQTSFQLLTLLLVVYFTIYLIYLIDLSFWGCKLSTQYVKNRVRIANFPLCFQLDKSSIERIGKWQVILLNCFAAQLFQFRLSRTTSIRFGLGNGLENGCPEPLGQWLVVGGGCWGSGLSGRIVVI